ncbi:unnamed protein product [Hymenolepis diminuta]|uniref:Uncharacterized protein n=1 Tax=Hymenolepis diminuta TaxID=6216 RepID=A0A564YAA6_HYMDI|nr:unnamed protein product [Hymenolepis diminuta]
MDDLPFNNMSGGVEEPKNRKKYGPKLVDRTVKTVKIKTIVKKAYEILKKPKESKRTENLCELEDLMPDLSASGSVEDSGALAEGFLNNLEAENHLKVKLDKELKSIMTQTEELPNPKPNALITTAVQTDCSHYSDQNSCQKETVIENEPMNVNDCKKSHSQSDVCKDEQEEEISMDYNDPPSSISLFSYCLSNATVEHDQSYNDVIEGEIFYDDHPQACKVETKSENSVEMEVNNCREPEKLQQHYLYFQMPIQNECASVSKVNEESEKPIDIKDLDVCENAESKKGKKKEKKHKKEKYKEKHDENIVYLIMTTVLKQS